jgi:D-alanine-D-alanine ligase
MSGNDRDGKKPVTVAVLFGGQSAEHDVSLKSTEALYTHIDKEAFQPLLLYISREDGKWRKIDEQAFVEKTFLSAPSSYPGYSFLPWLSCGCDELTADIYFPMLHGPNGEDGKIQSLLELAGKPYVGANSVASSLAMDKVVSKILFRDAGLNIVDFLFFQLESSDYKTIREKTAAGLGYPVFVKPSAMGSSVGVSRVDSESQMNAALDLAFRYDRKILIENALDAREIEVSVMGNDEIMVSRPGELIPHSRFYDYNDKYIDGKTTFHMPAKLEPAQEEKIRETAAKAYKSLFLNGMSRVDLFIDKTDGMIYINEINTIPGFTEISMFPKLWTLQGFSFTQLITRLIDYGFQYHATHHVSTDRE